MQIILTKSRGSFFSEFCVRTMDFSLIQDDLVLSSPIVLKILSQIRSVHPQWVFQNFLFEFRIFDPSPLTTFCSLHFLFLLVCVLFWQIPKSPSISILNHLRLNHLVLFKCIPYFRTKRVLFSKHTFFISAITLNESSGGHEIRVKTIGIVCS